MSGPIYKDVVIRTRIEHQGGGAPGSVDPLGRPASGSRTGSSGASPVDQKANGVGQQVENLFNKIKANNQVIQRQLADTARQRDQAHKKNIANIRYEADMILLERKRQRDAERQAKAAAAGQPGDFENYWNKVKANNRVVQMQIQQAMQQREAAHRKNMANIKAEAEMRIQMNRKETQARNAAQRGAGMQGNNYFSTGNKTLDLVNQKAFAGFITIMSAQVIGQVLKGLGTGITSALGQNDRSGVPTNMIGDMRSLVFGNGKLNPDGWMAGMQANGMGMVRWLHDNTGFNLRGAFNDPQNPSRFRARPQLNPAVMQWNEMGQRKSELQGILGLWEDIHGVARSVAEQELENSKERLRNARIEFGLLSTYDQSQVRDIVGRLNTGGPVTTEETRMLAQLGLTEGSKIQEIAEKRARQGGFEQIARDTGLLRDVEKAQAEADKLAPSLTVNGITINLETELEGLNKKLADQLDEAIKRELNSKGLIQYFEKQKAGETAPNPLAGA